MTQKRRSFLFFSIPFVFLFLSLAFPKECSVGAKNGLEIALFSALPALFPALVLSKILLFYFPQNGGKSTLFLPLTLGCLCGFPVGAITIARLFREGKISRKEGEKMLFFSNLAGPSFLIGFCGMTIFGTNRIGWLFFLCQTMLSLFFFLLFYRKAPHQNKKEESDKETLPFSKVLTLSLREASFSILHIGSCIVFFSFLSAMFFRLIPLSSFWQSFLCLFLELSGGMKTLASLPMKKALILCGAAIGWSGVSVHFQVLGELSEAGLSSKFYFFGKVVYALLLALAGFCFGFLL